ncbi:hypothetical protein BDP27DRAFT_1326826 [Rhodocollybia butyracea]|uniref:Uncharacterized protein n=1 Tax=Rhodocollybia butyracea TaxID=206335 RepID=A0A9P5PSR8_9AGAR|nr:hypothetical protein BDP27DRAFT_1326826 [Rhodocollybia butyracea]
MGANGGEILVKFTGDSGITSTFVEIIGHVVDATTVKKMGVINLKYDLNLQVANKVIKNIHDPRFFSTIFS